MNIDRSILLGFVVYIALEKRGYAFTGRRKTPPKNRASNRIIFKKKLIFWCKGKYHDTTKSLKVRDQRKQNYTNLEHEIRLELAINLSKCYLKMTR